MKRLQEILRAIHSWPEEARKLLAGLSFIISIVLIFGVWYIGVTYQLHLPSNILAPSKVSLDSKAPTPLENIKESLGSLARVMPNINYAKSDIKDLSPKLTNILLSARSEADQALNKTANFLFYGL